MPGPGNYSPSTKMVEEPITHGYSFGARSGSMELPNEKMSKTVVPGPGNYNIDSSSPAKKGAVFGTEQRPGVALQAQIKNPGPGAYSGGSNSPKNGSPTYKQEYNIIIVDLDHLQGKKRKVKHSKYQDQGNM